MTSTWTIILFCVTLQLTVCVNFEDESEILKKLYETVETIDGTEFVGKSVKNSLGIIQTKASTTYYFSKKAVEWLDAGRGCRGLYGGDATLLLIETENELETVNIFFQKTPDTGYRYWTGGRYNFTRGDFVWGNTGISVGHFAPWDYGHPKMNNDLKRTKIALTKPRGNVKVQTEDERNYLRYICEVS